MAREIMNDISGHDISSTYTLQWSPIDAKEVIEFDSKVDVLKAVWDKVNPEYPPWFVKTPMTISLGCLVWHERKKAGLYIYQKYTTDNESINRVIKVFTGHEKCEWPVFMCARSSSLIHRTRSCTAIFGQVQHSSNIQALSSQLCSFASLIKEERMLHTFTKLNASR